MTAWRRRGGAAAFATGLVVLVVCDLTIGAVRSWWDVHSLTASVVASLLVLGVTALIVDEVMARRQRKDRSVSVAVQSLIVFDQTRRAAGAVEAEVAASDAGARQAPEELRSLTGMLLTASPNLFDDPQARGFLESVQRLAGSMFRLVAGTAEARADPEGLDRMRAQVAQVHDALAPLLARLPGADVASFLERVPGAAGT